MSLTSFLLAGLVVGAATNSTAALRLPSDIVEATVCDLAQRPLEFENKHVRVRGTVKAGLEYFGLSDDACPRANSTGGGIWLDFTVGEGRVLGLEIREGGPARLGGTPVLFRKVGVRHEASLLLERDAAGRRRRQPHSSWNV